MLDGLIGAFGSDAARRTGDRFVRAWDGDHVGQVIDPRLIVRTTSAPASVGPVTCVLLGELHNAGALALRHGAPEDTPSAAVLARAYAACNEGALTYARGSFVALIWDTERRRGVLAQDHLANRSVFLCAQEGVLLFATELNLLLHGLSRRPEPDEAALMQWMATRMLTDRRTLFLGVERLGWGQLLRLSDERWERRTFWRPRYDAPPRRSRAEAATSLRTSLEHAVGARLAPSGQLGILLSGGLDSGSVMSTAARLLGDGEALPKAYSLVMDDPDNDETPYLEVMRQRFMFANTRIRVRGPGALAASFAFLQRYEVPLVAPGYIMDQQLLRRAADDGIEDILDGQGGDELFGIAQYLLADRLRRGRPMAAFQLAGRMAGEITAPTLKQRRWLLRYYAVRGALPPSAMDVLRRRRGPSAYAPSWFQPRSAQLLFSVEDPERWKREPGVPRWWAHAAHVLTDSRETIGLADYLRRRSELEGLRARSPLLDVDMVELVLRLPPELAFHARLDRALARESLKGLLPDPVRLRQAKSNFGGFIQQILARDEIGDIRRILMAPDAEIRRYVDVDAVGRVLLEAPPGPWEPGWVSWGPAVWSLLTAETWLRRQAGDDGDERIMGNSGLAEATHDVLAVLPAAAT